MSKSDLPSVLKSFWLSDTDISGTYLVRLRPSDNLPTEVPRSQHQNQYDVTILPKAEFIKRVKQGSLIEMVCILM
jgi:hypothetical protein